MIDPIILEEVDQMVTEKTQKLKIELVKLMNNL